MLLIKIYGIPYILKFPAEKAGNFILHIYFSPVSDCDCQDNKLIIFYNTNHSIIANSISPESFFISLQCFSIKFRIFTIFYMFFCPVFNQFLGVFIQLLIFFIKPWGCSKFIFHISNSSHNFSIGLLFLLSFK